MTKRKTSKGGSSNGRTPVSKTGNVGSSPTPPAKSKGGRPSKYSPELVASICERLGKGEPLACVCREDGMPAYRTVKDWMDEDSDRGRDVSAAIAHARESGFDQIAKDALGIADDGSRDYSPDEDGFCVNHDHIQRSKLRVETRLKLLAKWDPKRYGDKVQLSDNEGGKLASPPPPAVINIIGVAPGAK